MNELFTRILLVPIVVALIRLHFYRDKYGGNYIGDEVPTTSSMKFSLHQDENSSIFLRIDSTNKFIRHKVLHLRKGKTFLAKIFNGSPHMIYSIIYAKETVMGTTEN